MSDWIIDIAGTAEGARLALWLALMSALFHAIFGALQKSVYHPLVMRGAIDVWLVVLAAPVAIFVTPWPDARGFLILLGAMGVHFCYKVTVALAYERAAYTVVYPMIRGTGTLVTVLGAALIFQEHFNPLQWGGVGVLWVSMFLLALRNLGEEKANVSGLQIGMIWALIGGLTVAIYTIYDAWGIRMSPDPFTFLAWFFFLSSLDMPVLALLHARRFGTGGPCVPLFRRGFLGALIALISFGGIMLATRVDQVGEAAVLRETSPVFAALIGWFVMGEKVGPRRLVLMALIAMGAILVELGGRA